MSSIALGVVGLDGHGPVFTQVVNGGRSLGNMRVTAAMPVPSAMISEEKLAENVEKTRALGVVISDSPSALASEVDGILILHDDGSKHLELARDFARFGKPMFVDKPFEVTQDRARCLARTCRENSCPVFSASSLRFAAELRGLLSHEEDGKILSAMTYSPYMLSPSMPGWLYYGVHAVEPLYQILGVGCKEVRCLSGRNGPVAVGTWEDGRTGIARATSPGHTGFGFTVWRENASRVAAVDCDILYPELLKEIAGFVETGVAPVEPDESVEVVAFMEAANRSMEANGAPVPVGG